jgi:hypothetical protein
MPSFRLGLVGATLAGLLTGCDGGGSATETTLPKSAPVLPAEADQMKKDMENRLHNGPAKSTKK